MTTTNVDGLGELWKDVPGFEGIYQVSTLGNVKVLDRLVLNSRYGEELHIKRKGKVLKLSISKKAKGYYVASLTTNNKTKQFFVHRLVASAFIGPLPEGLFVNHIDGNKLNNIPSNLEYVTTSENLLHAFKNGLNTSRKRTRRCSLSDEQVRQIRDMYKEGLSVTEIGRRVGYKPSRVTELLNGKRYSWVK